MRDAFGGAFSIKLMLIFLILYVSFICVALNYARAFRVKNRIINIIEQNEGYDVNAANEIDIYLGNTGYYIAYDQIDENSCHSNNFHGLGYCIEAAPNEANTEYYRVKTYMVFRLPIINVNFPITIKGETRRITIPNT